MRICFELLDMLKAHKKSIRRATVNTFGYIAKAIGPQDVLATFSTISRYRSARTASARPLRSRSSLRRAAHLRCYPA